MIVADYPPISKRKLVFNALLNGIQMRGGNDAGFRQNRWIR
jgi:hypothetical protein